MLNNHIFALKMNYNELQKLQNLSYWGWNLQNLNLS